MEHIDLGFVPQYNMLAGGVLFYSRTFIPMKKTYHSALPGLHHNRQPARKVDISSTAVITPEEFAQLTPEQFDNLDSNNSTPLETRIRQRAEEQIQRTLNHPDVPRPHYEPGIPVLPHGPRKRRHPVRERRTHHRERDPGPPP